MNKHELKDAYSTNLPAFALLKDGDALLLHEAKLSESGSPMITTYVIDDDGPRRAETRVFTSSDDNFWMAAIQARRVMAALSRSWLQISFLSLC